MVNRHLTRYNNIVNHYKSTVTEGYVEKHHIIPKCMGGTDDFDNLVALPPKAHIICHYLLHKAYPENTNLAHAFAMMTVNNKNQNRIFSSKIYHKSRIARSFAMKKFKHTEETKMKMRKPKKSKINYRGPKSKTHAKNISKALKGIPRTDEHNAALSESLKKVWAKKKELTESKIAKIRKEFIASNMTRQEFYKHTNFNKSYSMLKKYLKGL